MQSIEFKADNIISDINLKEKDVSIIISDKSEDIRQYIVLNKAYYEDENGKIKPKETEYIKTNFYNISGYNLVEKAVFKQNEIKLYIKAKENKFCIIINDESVEMSKDLIKSFKFVLKDKIELKRETISV